MISRVTMIYTNRMSLEKYLMFILIFKVIFFMNNFKRECMASGDREEKTVFVIIPLSSDFSQRAHYLPTFLWTWLVCRTDIPIQRVIWTGNNIFVNHVPPSPSKNHTLWINTHENLNLNSYITLQLKSATWSTRQDLGEKVNCIKVVGIQYRKGVGFCKGTVVVIVPPIDLHYRISLVFKPKSWTASFSDLAANNG